MEGEPAERILTAYPKKCNFHLTHVPSVDYLHVLRLDGCYYWIKVLINHYYILM